MFNYKKEDIYIGLHHNASRDAITGNDKRVRGITEEIVMMGPPIAIYDDERKIYLSLLLTCSKDMTQHRYSFAVSRYELPLNFGEEEISPRYISDFIVGGHVLENGGFDLKTPQRYKERIEQMENITESKKNLYLNKWEKYIDDEVLLSVPNVQCQIGYRSHMDIPLLAAEEYVGIDNQQLWFYVKEVIYLFQQIVKEKYGLYFSSFIKA